MSDNTMIVPARIAWPEYQRFGSYVCQPDRAFRTGVDHLGFYAEGAIQPLVPAIHEYLPSVKFTLPEAERHRTEGRPKVAAVITRFLEAAERDEGAEHGVFVLSGPDDAATVRLPGPITNDATSNGRTVAWARSQRYTSIERLRSGVKRTSQL